MKINCWWKKALLALGFVIGSVSAANADITVTFTNQTYAALNFTQIAPNGSISGTLTGVAVNATLNASLVSTYADDLTIYVDVLPLSTAGLLQVGGFSDLSATQRISWANGASATVGTTVIDNVAVNPIVFSGTAADPVVWLGNGWGGAGASGTWTGSVTLFGVNAVPEPTSLMLSALGMGLVGFGTRRRRTV